MDSINLLKGYLLSKFVHGLRIMLISGVSTAFICHTTIAQNKPNKAPGSDEGGGDGYNYTFNPLNSNNTNLIAYTSHTEKNYFPFSLTNSPSESNGTLSYSAAVNANAGGGDDKLESYYFKLQSYHVLENVQQKVNASAEDFKQFLNYYHDRIYADDRNTFWNMVEAGKIKTDADVANYADWEISQYVQLYTSFLDIKKNYPNSVNEYANNVHHPDVEALACNPACDNIDFENGTLSGWSAYYATNTSNSLAFSNSAPVGGSCGAVTKSAFDPVTNTNQVTLMSGPGLDPIAGALIPVVCPTGGSYSCRIGDSTRNGAQMGILEQTFTVTPTNANFVYMYAVVLENPFHVYYEQPYFNVQMLDQYGNPIPNCGNYSVVSGPGLPGYKSIYYKKDNDTVYCKPWTTVFVPLQNYIGQCITIKVTASDCALGGHFGYAYFDATCSVGVISSSPVLCGKNDTLTGPNGVSAYKWIGPCIIGPDTDQQAVVGCAGTYSVVLSSVANSGCSDTITLNVPSAVPVTVSVTGTNITCNGMNNGTAKATVGTGVAPYTYLWSPGGGTSASLSNLSAGTYTVTVTDSSGCQDTASITITQPTALAATITASNISPCYGDSNGSAKVNVTGGTPTYTYSWSPKGGTGATASNLSAGSYTVNVTDAHNCTISATVNITEPPAINVTISSHHNDACHGDNNGAAVAFASGGTPSYNYLWSNGQTTKSSTSLTSGIYTITVTDANGCKASDTVVITQPAALVVTNTIVSEVLCFGQSNGQASASASGGTGPYSYSWNTTPKQTGPNATGLSAGTYVVTATDSNGCKGTDTVIISQPALLTATTTVSSDVSCKGDSNGSAAANATGGTAPYSYTWSNGNTSATISNLSAGTYTVNITDFNGCNTTASVTITQPANALSATISSASGVSCNGGNNGNATVTPGGGTGPYKYSWSNGNATASDSNLVAGTYTVIITDAHGCTATAMATITQPTALVASLGSGSNVSCYGGSNGSATVVVTGGTSPYKYSWTGGSSSATASGLSAGSYTVTVTDSNGCSSSSTVTITQPGQLVASITSTSNVSCNGGNNGSATVSASGGTPSYAYAWSSGSSSVSASNLSAGTYTIVVKDANGCSATASVTITEPAPLSTTFSPAPPSCNGMSNGSATASPTGGTAPYVYLWSTVPAQSSQTASGLSAGTYSVTITDANGCTLSNNTTLTQPTVLTASIGGKVNPACYGYSNGGAGVVPAGGTGPYTYSWSTVPVQTTAAATGLSAGTYTATVTDAHGCTATTNVTLIQPAKVITTVTGPDTICSGNAITLSASSSGGNGTYFYHWSNGGGPAPAITVAPANTTTYTVTAIDGKGCMGDTVSITVKTLKLMPAAVTMSNPQTICQGDTASVYANVDTTNSGHVNLNWSNGFKGSGPFNVTPSVTTTYSVTVADQCGNTVTKSVTITVNPVPVVNLQDQSGASCKSVSLNFKDTNSANNGDTYYWTFGDNESSSLSNPSHEYIQGGRYIVTVTVTAPSGCKSEAQANMNITIYPTPVAQFTVNPYRESVLNPSFAFTDNSLNTTQWLWDFGDGNTAKMQNPTHTYAPVVADYKVELVTTNNYGCIDSTSDSVHVVPDFRIYIPNAFSPNSDGLNDYFTAKGIGIVTFNMMIFDRWGNLLYTTDDINRGWNGTVGGDTKIAQEDTYVYKIQVTDIFKEQHSYIGAVTLIK